MIDSRSATLRARRIAKHFKAIRQDLYALRSKAKPDHRSGTRSAKGRKNTGRGGERKVLRTDRWCWPSLVAATRSGFIDGANQIEQLAIRIRYLSCP
jgi:hypothetical protein